MVACHAVGAASLVVQLRAVCLARATVGDVIVPVHRATAAWTQATSEAEVAVVGVAKLPCVVERPVDVATWPRFLLTRNDGQDMVQLNEEISID